MFITDRMLGTIPKSFSNDTLDMSSVDSISLDEHIEIKIPEARARENRLMAQNNFVVQHINEKSRNGSHNHLAVENGHEYNNHPPVVVTDVREKEHGHMHRSHSHASMKKAHHGLTPNGINHAGNGHDHSKINK